MSLTRNTPKVSSLANFFARASVRDILESNLRNGKSVGRIVFNELPDMEHLNSLFTLYQNIIKDIDLQSLQELVPSLQSSDSPELVAKSFNKIPPKLKAWIYLVYATVMFDLFNLKGNFRIGIQEALKDFKLETQLSREEMPKAFFTGYSQHIAACTVPKKQSEAGQEEMCVEYVASSFVTSAIDVKCKELVANKKSIRKIRAKVCDELFKLNDENKIQNKQLSDRIKLILSVLYCSELNKFYEANEAIAAYQTAQIKLRQEVADNENANSRVLAKATEIYQKIDRPLDSDDIKKIYLLARVLNATADGFRDNTSISEYEHLIKEVEMFDDTKPLVASMLVVLTSLLIVASIFSIIATGGGAIPFLVAGLFSLSAAGSLGGAIYLFKRGNDTVQLADLTRTALLPDTTDNEEKLSSSQILCSYK